MVYNLLEKLEPCQDCLLNMLHVLVVDGQDARRSSALVEMNLLDRTIKRELLPLC